MSYPSYPYNTATGTNVVSSKYAGDLSNMKQELAALQGGGVVTKTVTVRSGSPVKVSGTAAEGEVTTLYHELQRAAAKLEVERSARKRAEAELDNIRQHRLRETGDVVQELERKSTELNTLKEERAMMREWLDRGVQECKRVADDVTRLKAELDQSEANVASLQHEKSRLEELLQEHRLTIQRMEADREAERAYKESLERRLQEMQEQLNTVERERISLAAENDNLHAQNLTLQQRLRYLDEAEQELQRNTAKAQQMVAELSEIERAMVSGDLDRGEDERYIPVTEAMTTGYGDKGTQEIITHSREEMQELNDAANRLRASIKRYVAVRSKDVAENRVQNESYLERMRREQELMREEHSNDVGILQRRIEDLERDLVLASDGGGYALSHDRMTIIDKADELNAQLRDRCDELMAENERLRLAANRMKLDWGKVDESRRRFQQLEGEMVTLREQNEILRQENKAFRGQEGGHRSLNVGTGGWVTASSSDRNAFEQWRRTMAQSQAQTSPQRS